MFLVLFEALVSFKASKKTVKQPRFVGAFGPYCLAIVSSTYPQLSNPFFNLAQGIWHQTSLFLKLFSENISNKMLYTLPKTNIAPENGCLEYEFHGFLAGAMLEEGWMVMAMLKGLSQIPRQHPSIFTHLTRCLPPPSPLPSCQGWCTLAFLSLQQS